MVGDQTVGDERGEDAQVLGPTRTGLTQSTPRARGNGELRGYFGPTRPGTPGAGGRTALALAKGPHGQGREPFPGGSTPGEAGAAQTPLMRTIA